MRIYVAGGSSERLTVVRPIMDRLRAYGHTIAHDWTACEGYDRESDTSENLAWASLDLLGVETAETVWIVAPEAKSEGSACEMGFALGLGKRIVVSGPTARRRDRIFCLLANEIHDTHESALASLCSAPRAPRQLSVVDDL